MRALLLLMLPGLLLGCSPAPEEASPPPVAATTAPTPTRPDPDPAPSPPLAERLLRSGPPRAGYVDDHVLVLPDGGEVALPRRWGTTAIEEYAGGYLVTDDRSFEGTVGMHRLDGDGRVLASWAGTGPALVSRDGRIAWVSLVAPESGRNGPTLLHVDDLEGGGERTVELDRTRIPFLVRWFRGGVVHRAWGRDASYLTDGSGPPVPVPLAQDLGVPSPDGRRWARVVDGGLELRSGDGQLVDLVRARGLGQASATPPAWEDNRTLLTTLTRGRRMALARVDTRSGRVSLATAWRPATYAGIAVLPAR